MVLSWGSNISFPLNLSKTFADPTPETDWDCGISYGVDPVPLLLLTPWSAIPVTGVSGSAGCVVQGAPFSAGPLPSPADDEKAKLKRLLVVTLSFGVVAAVVEDVEVAAVVDSCGSVVPGVVPAVEVAGVVA